MTVEKRSKDRLIKPKGRFAKEKKQKYTPVKGSFHRALLILRDVFSEETLGVSDTTFWSKIEEKASDMNERQVCFQYYLAQTGHLTLAENLLNYFPTVRAGVSSGDIPTEQYSEWRDRLSGELLGYYPQRYHDELRRKKNES